MGFTLSCFISQIHPRDIFRLLAIGMCHFLPVHHFVIACLLGPKVKIQQYHIYICSDVLLWTPTNGRAKAGRPVRTYIQQLCEGTGCSPEDLPEAMNDREKWRERVKNIRAGGTT